MIQRLARLAPVLLAAALPIACADDPGDPAGSADYAGCGELQNNQMVTCDSLYRGVEELCGFNLTIDPCGCADEVLDCVQDRAWLEQILACEESAAGCTEYIACLEAVGEAPSGCDAPTDWDCLTSKDGAAE